MRPISFHGSLLAVLALGFLVCVDAAREGDESGKEEKAQRMQPSAHRQEGDAAAVSQHGVNRHEVNASANGLSTEALAALADMGSALKQTEQFLAFLKSKEHHHKATSASLPCSDQWAQHAERLKESQSKLFQGMKKVREAHVLLAAVDTTHWSDLFRGSQRNDPESAEKVNQALNVGGTLLGRLDGLGENYDERLKSLTGEEHKALWMRHCEELASRVVPQNITEGPQKVTAMPDDPEDDLKSDEEPAANQPAANHGALAHGMGYGSYGSPAHRRLSP